jgi:hypothetical protein
MNLSDDDAANTTRQRRQSQDVNLTVQPIQVNVRQTVDQQVIAKLDAILAALTTSDEDRAKMVQLTAQLKAHTDALKQAADAAKTQTP